LLLLLLLLDQATLQLSNDSLLLQLALPLCFQLLLQLCQGSCPSSQLLCLGLERGLQSCLAPVLLSSHGCQLAPG
jgi:hypothetical protein